MNEQVERAPEWFQTVVWASLQSGLCALIPVPFVDDWARDIVRRRLARSLIGQHGAPVPDEGIERLCDGRLSFGCLGILSKVVLYPIKKIFKKIIYILAIKEATEILSAAFHEGFLWHAALKEGALDAPEGEWATPQQVDRLREAVVETLEEVDTRPIQRTIRRAFRGARSLARSAAAVVYKDLKEDENSSSMPDSAEGKALLDRFTDALWGEDLYLEQLTDQLVGKLIVD